MPKIPLSEELQKQYDPIEYLIYRAQKTEIPFVYKNLDVSIDPSLPLVILHLGPSGGGKDATIDPLLQSGLLVHAVTATSRERRVETDEAEDKYVWMRAQKKTESEEEYHKNLVKEYDLLEYDKHFGALYGLPKASIYDALERGTPVIRTEPRGAKTIIEKLKGEMNFVVTFVVPESYELLWERIYNRSSPTERIEKAIDEIKDAPNVANYFLYNPVEFNGKPGLPQVQNAMSTLVEKLQAKLD